MTRIPPSPISRPAPPLPSSGDPLSAGKPASLDDFETAPGRTQQPVSIAELVQRQPSPPPPGLATGRGLSVLGQLTYRIVQSFQEPPADLAAFDTVSADREGAGFSLGLLRWSLGSGDLQPLLRRFLSGFRDLAREALGSEERLQLLERIVDTEPEVGLDLTRRHLVEGDSFRDGWGESLTRLAGDAAFRRLQWRRAAAHILQRQTFRELQLLSVEEMQELIDRLSRTEIAAVSDDERSEAPDPTRRFEPFAGLEGDPDDQAARRRDEIARETQRRHFENGRRSIPHPP
ncbi:MAG: hypothetical protein AAF604_19590 [Acidobacteriota bacterium]